MTSSPERNAYAAYTPQGGIDSLVFERVWRVNAGRSYDVTSTPRCDYQIICVRTAEGVGRVSFKDGACIDVTPGSVLFFRYAECARYRCYGEQWHFWWFVFRPEGALTLPFRELMHVPAAYPEFDELESCFRLLLSAGPAAVEFAALRMRARVAGYVHAWRRDRGAPDATTTAVERAIALMHANPAGLTVTRMAAEAFLGARRFRDIFRKVTGTTPKRYYDQLRLEHAAQLLIATPSSSAQIADRLGFSSPYHFSRAFKTQFGRAPSAYRRGM
jgi:AraC-like DNA-binding protein